MKILIVIGTRPNFIKVTQFKNAVKKYQSLDLKIVHTGQHFDEKMADVFFNQLNLIPDYFLNIPSGSPNMQMAEIMLRLEKLISHTYKPDLILVVGDVNSTLAAALTSNKLGIKLGHIESGLRSMDRTMPEEINRILTDELTDFFFVTEQSGYDNLLKEGKSEKQLFFVGNTMIDTLVAFKEQINCSTVTDEYDLQTKKFILLTMHRPATVDNESGLKKLLSLINWLSEKYKVVFPIHPRTLKNIDGYNLTNDFKNNKNLVLCEPLDYFSFQKLTKESLLIITDSGGIQEESTFLQKPCLTLRPNTERPVTVTEGTNTLVPFELDTVKRFVQDIEQGYYKKGTVPKFWDGESTQRILKVLNTLSI